MFLATGFFYGLDRKIALNQYMQFVDNLVLGASAALSLYNLAICFVGVLLGTLIGVLPGIGPLAAVAMLLPLTWSLGDPLSSLIMMAGIYYGSQYGGSTTAIMLKIPGEVSSVITALDGHAMARSGQAGSALATAALGSFVAGTLATMIVALGAPALSQVAFGFGSAEYFALMLLGLVAALLLNTGTVASGAIMIVLGMFLGAVGTDVNTGLTRFTGGSEYLVDGIEFGVIIIGLFGLGEILYNLYGGQDRTLVSQKIHGLLMSARQWQDSWPAWLRGTAVGSVLGVIPGSISIPPLAAYALEKKLAPGRPWGQGVIQGVAAPEAANNAAAQVAFIPSLTLGIPTMPIMSLIIAAMIMQGVTPSPQIIDANPVLFWGLVVSMWVGNAMLLVLNLPLIKMWVKVLTIPQRILYPAILVLSIYGAWSFNHSWFDVMLLAPLALAGFLFRRWGWEIAPLLMGFVLGRPMEEHWVKIMMISNNDIGVFLHKPLAASLLALALVLLVTAVWRKKG